MGSSSDQARSKLALYIVLTALVFVLQRWVLNRLELGGIVPQLMPFAVTAVAMLEGSRPGAWFGLGTGLVAGLMTEGASLIWFYALLGALWGGTRNKLMGGTFPGYLLCALGSILLLEGGTLLWGLAFAGEELAAMVPIALAEGGWSMAFAPLLYLPHWLIDRRIPADLRW